MASNYLRCRKGIYYVRIRVPQDLKHLINRDELNQSLKTTDKTVAKLISKDFLFKVNRQFVLLRSGYLDEQQKQQILCQLTKQDNTINTTSSTFTMSMLINDYVQANQLRWRMKSKMEVEFSLNLAVQVMGDMGLEDVTRENLKEYKNALLKLPANFSKSPQYRTLTIAKILALDDVKPMSLTSVNKHLSWLGSMLNHAVKEGYITSSPGLGLKVQRNSRVDLERMAYNVEDIITIVSCLPCDPMHPERYWVPMIGMFQGMRLNEIC